MESLGLQGFRNFSIRILKQIVLAGSLATLVACGGGGGGNGGDDHEDDFEEKPIVSFTLSVNVSGLTQPGLVLQNNGADDLLIAENAAGNATYTFSEPILFKNNYVVTVKTQPTDQLCTVKNGSGIAVAAISAISVVCSSAENSFTIGGSVTGLDEGEKVTLFNNDGDALTITADQSFTFATPVAFNSGYKVTVATQPGSQICTVNRGTGNGVIANITNIKVICSTNNYSIGGTISGLNKEGLVVMLNNSSDPLIIEANGTFAFATAVAHGSDYEVTIANQPVGQTCSVPNPKGYYVTADVTDIIVLCSANTFTIGGNVIGLDPGDQVTLVNNFDSLGNSKTIYAAEPAFTFDTPVAFDGGYLVTVATQPIDKTCTVTNGTGKGVNDNITNITVLCSKKTYSIGGTITGLKSGELVILLNNSDDALKIDASKSTFEFEKPVAHGSGYRVTVTKQPEGQICSVIKNGSRDLVEHDIDDIKVECSALTYTIGGFVFGLNSGEQVTLANNGDIDNATTVKANEQFAFKFPVVYDGSFEVEVTTQPTGQVCALKPGTGSGKMVRGIITSVIVECSTNMYAIGGTTIGLKPGNQVSLINESKSGVDRRTISGDGSFSFKLLPFNSDYNIRIAGAQPVGQFCKVINGKGDNVQSDINNISLECSNNMYTMEGTITGLSAGNKITVNNGTDELELLADGSDIKFKFPTLMGHGAKYIVTVTDKPIEKTCDVFKGAGEIIGNVDDILVSCSTTSFRIGGKVSTLKPGNTLVLYNNGTDRLTISENGGFYFDKRVASSYSVSISEREQPSGQYCSVHKGSGESITNDVSDIEVTCDELSYPIPIKLNGLAPGKSIKLKNSGEERQLFADGNFEFSSKVTHGGSYAVTVSASPVLQDCEVKYGSGSGVTGPVTPVEVTCKMVPFTSLYSFTGQDLTYPVGLMRANNGDIYGIATMRMNDNHMLNGKTGHIFKMTPDGKMAQPIHWFIGAGKFTQQDPSFPTGIMQAKDGTIYGTTFLAGTKDVNYADGGAIYKLNTPSFVQNSYMFPSAASQGPIADLIQDADGHFYGITYGNILVSENNKAGSIFKRDLNTGAVTTLYTFQFNTSAINGARPNGRLVLASDGFLYGTTEKGGTKDKGVIFKINPKDPNPQLTFKAIHSFDFVGSIPRQPGVGIGELINDPYARPYSGFMQASDGSLYGVAKYGGDNDAGWIFKVTLPEGKLTKVYSFAKNNGYPVGELIQLKDDNLYGTTLGDGVTNMGSIFSIKPDGSSYTVLHSFAGGDGNRPSTRLVVGSDGESLYGGTRFGGVHDQGTIYKFGRK